MKEKQQRAFPSLALISPLSGRGAVVNVLTRWLDGGRRATEGKKKARRKERKTTWEGWRWVVIRALLFHNLNLVSVYMTNI